MLVVSGREEKFDSTIDPFFAQTETRAKLATLLIDSFPDRKLSLTGRGGSLVVNSPQGTSD